MSTTSFNDRAENTHQVEFEAPNSAEVQPLNHKERKHFSIDLSLELEHQLNMESPPVTPRRYPYTAALDTPEHKHEALDPEVLAHLVSQLRQSLGEMTRERDDLAKLLAAAHSKEAGLTDALQLMTEKATETGEELESARKKNKEDEEAIALLRAKVEESRRGLMRLQTENRRQSMTPIDVNRASLAGMLTSPPASSKRNSFTPLTGRSTSSHRRVSSVSDVVFALPVPDSNSNPSPNAQVLTFPPETPGNPPPLSSARYPSLFGRQSPPHPDNSDHLSSNTGSEIKELQTALVRVKEELSTVRHELQEANEARQASETCVEALRQFIAENSFSQGESSGAPGSIKLPPPPTMTTGAEDDVVDNNGTNHTAKRTGAAMGWGFKLWGGDQGSPVVPQTAPISGPRGHQAAGSLSTSAPLVQAAPFSRKLGGLFGSSRSASVSSIHSATLPIPPPPLQTNASIIQRNISHGSTRSSTTDASSVVEPVSPGSDIHGLGTGTLGRRNKEGLASLEDINLDAGSIKHEHGVVHIRNLDLEVVR